jgi:cytoskeleton protein RodZ
MPTLGQRLREEREKRGLTIEEIAAKTRIHAHYFVAIEEGDRAALPGGFFYRSFIRQYARLLELPDEAYASELTRDLEQETASVAALGTALPQRPIEVAPMPTGRVDAAEETRKWLVRGGALAIVLAVCSGVYGLWQHWKAQQESSANKVSSAIHERLADKPPEPVKQPESKPPEPQPQETKAEETKQPEQKPAQTPPAATKQEPEPVRPTPATTTPTPQAAAAQAAPAAKPAGAVRVSISASEATWVDVWQGEKQVYSNLVRPGEVKSFGSGENIRVRLGNAGGVEIEWNDKVIPPTGPRGQIRTVDFRPDGYRVILPPPKNPQATPAATPPQQG